MATVVKWQQLLNGTVLAALLATVVKWQQLLNGNSC
jgi:hypothetical protein